MIDEEKLAKIRSRLPPLSLRGNIRHISSTVEGYVEILDTLKSLWRVARALEMTRGQWIHSVNAKECLEALAALHAEEKK